MRPRYFRTRSAARDFPSLAFMARYRIEPGDNACWLWTGGARTPKGYGRFCNTGAHRYAYELFVGPIPAGLTIDHICRNASNRRIRSGAA